MNAKTHHEIQSYLFFLIQELKGFQDRGYNVLDESNK